MAVDPVDFELLLVPTDFSAAAGRALARALWLAKRWGSTVHLLHVMEPYDTGPLSALRQDSDSPREVSEEAVRDLLASTVRRHDAADVPVEPVVLSPRPVVEAVRGYADANDVDLIVTGRNRHRGVLGRRRIGSTTHALLLRARQPIMVVPSDETRQEDAADGVGASVGHVLLPVDFTDPSERAVPVARRLAACCDASLSLLFVAEHRTVPVFQDTGLFSFATLEPDAEIVERAPEALAQLFESTDGPDVPCSYHVRESDDAVEEILAFADDQGVDLIVLPSFESGDAHRFELGGVTESVLRRAHCPVGIVRPAEGV